MGNHFFTALFSFALNVRIRVQCSEVLPGFVYTGLFSNVFFAFFFKKLNNKISNVEKTF